MENRYEFMISNIPLGKYQNQSPILTFYIFKKVRVLNNSLWFRRGSIPNFIVYFANINQTPFPLLNVAAYWKSSNTEACANKLSQILTNNIDNKGSGVGLRIFVTYCSFQHLFRLLFFCWVTVGHTVHPNIKELLSSAAVKPTSFFQNSVSKVLQVHAIRFS